jgi:hypothetical protein
MRGGDHYFHSSRRWRGTIGRRRVHRTDLAGSCAGYTRVWTAQMPWQPILMSVLAVALREVQGIELGTAVLPRSRIRC